ncbi:hypothetical protein EON63_16860 [archaeon]|nr:MAG: hypothetical protein EON63_16860 [archaeon]
MNSNRISTLPEAIHSMVALQVSMCVCVYCCQVIFISYTYISPFSTLTLTPIHHPYPQSYSHPHPHPPPSS